MLRMWNLNQAAAEVGVGKGSDLGKYTTLPAPDVVAGVPDDWQPGDPMPRGAVRLWAPDTIRAWAASRATTPGRPRKTEGA
ncbi:hypothetical protein EF294_15745 [Gordonia oryzae]|uniref:Uncharacterized protein n=1 Tax=Gordonia oryzae TaxID=2487349 RepID=A0A3N4G9B4_9ACTN|nr:hypothetical protein [Gordonia oryzae]RPA58608.1 hypothetical protein EF294_15745 [Gordonia oryzae]